MAHHGQKFALGPVGLVGGVLGGLQAAQDLFAVCDQLFNELGDCLQVVEVCKSREHARRIGRRQRQQMGCVCVGHQVRVLHFGGGLSQHGEGFRACPIGLLQTLGELIEAIH